MRTPLEHPFTNSRGNVAHQIVRQTTDGGFTDHLSDNDNNSRLTIYLKRTPAEEKADRNYTGKEHTYEQQNHSDEDDNEIIA